MTDITPIMYAVVLIVYTLSLCTVTIQYVSTLRKRFVRQQLAPFPQSMYGSWIVMVISALWIIDGVLWAIVTAVVGILVWIVDYDNRLALWRQQNNDHDQ